MGWFGKKENTKSKEAKQTTWCVILNKPRPVMKSQITKKLQETFSVSEDFADELIGRSPIMLLDNLTGKEASATKEFLQSSGADLVVTNDVSVKRKCFRVEWQEKPSLSFLYKETNEPEEQEQVQRLPLPVNHMKPQKETAVPVKESRIQEVETKLEESVLEVQKKKTLAPVTFKADSREQEERMHSIREELAEAKDRINLLREDIVVLNQTKEILQRAITESQGSLETARKMTDILERDKLELTKSLEEARVQNRAKSEELEELKSKNGLLSEEIQALRPKLQSAEESLQESLGKLEIARKTSGELEADKEELTRALDKARNQCHKLEEEAQKSWDFFEKKTNDLKREIDAAKVQAEELRHHDRPAG